MAQRFGMGSMTHTKAYLHRDNVFAEGWPELHAKLTEGMKIGGAAAWQLGEVELNVRCVEYHTYTTGGGLTSPAHRDGGSVLTMAILLSDAADVEGGDFVTYTDGAAVAHRMDRGDAILFCSEKCHNVTTVKSGTRQSMVLELWEHPQNLFDRHS
jgi:hypothetical protein